MGEGRSLAGIGMRKSDSRVKGASRGAENFKRGWLDVDVTVAAADPPRKVPHNLFYDTGLAILCRDPQLPVAAYTVLGPAISHHHLDSRVTTESHFAVLFITASIWG